MDGMWNEPADDQAFPSRPDLSSEGGAGGESPPTIPAWGQAEGWAFPEAPPGPGERPRRGRAALAAVLVALVLLSASVGIGWIVTRHHRGTALSSSSGAITPAPQSQAAANAALNLPAIANTVNPGIVDINTAIDAVGGQPPTARAAGTGMVLTSSGEVLTNNHVIAGATTITVTVASSGRTYPASVVGADPPDDVALLQLQAASGLATVSLADSATVGLGQKVAAIGNALGRGGTPAITGGSVTALRQSIAVRDDSGRLEQLHNLIQTDAQISPGDSGGPLVNASGQVVGMITAGAKTLPNQTRSDTGYAIPVNDAVVIVNKIRGGQSSDRIIIGPAGFLGVAVQAVDAATATQLSVNGGALVIQVVPGTAAQSAGISVGSVITSVGGRSIGSPDQLGPAIYVHKPGERVSVTWVDGSGSHTTTVALTSGPAV